MRNKYPERKESVIVIIFNIIKGLFLVPLKWTLILFGVILAGKAIYSFGTWDSTIMVEALSNLSWLRWTFIAFFGFNIYLYISELIP